MARIKNTILKIKMYIPAHLFQYPAAGTRNKRTIMQDDENISRKHGHQTQ